MEPIDEHDQSESETELYSFLMKEEPIISQLIDTVRSMPTRPNLPPETISRIGTLLFAMERLPLVTPDIQMSLILIYELNRESDWMDITIDSDNFRLGKGFHSYDPGVGGDTHSEFILEAGIGYRGVDTFQAYEFAEVFADIAQDAERRVTIDSYSDEPFFAWDLEPYPDAWERLASEYL